MLLLRYQVGTEGQNGKGTKKEEQIGKIYFKQLKTKFFPRNDLPQRRRDAEDVIFGSFSAPQRLCGRSTKMAGCPALWWGGSQKRKV